MNPKVKEKYNNYPLKVKTEILKLRDLILLVANSDEQIDFLGEELKWGEPSFLTKSSGSTIRIDWKNNNPNHISIFVNCRTKLISIFKELYPQEFDYIGNRELRLPLDQKYSEQKLLKCIELALKYNLVKNNF